MSSGPGIYFYYHSDGDPDPQKVHDYVDLSQDGSPTANLALFQMRIQEYIETHGPLNMLKFDYVPKLFTEQEAKDLGLGSSTLFKDAGNPGVTHSVLNTLAQDGLPDGN